MIRNMLLVASFALVSLMNACADKQNFNQEKRYQIISCFAAKPENLSQFIDLLKQMVILSSVEEKCIKSQGNRTQGNNSLFTWVQDWQSEEDYTQHANKPEVVLLAAQLALFVEEERKCFSVGVDIRKK